MLVMVGDEGWAVAEGGESGRLEGIEKVGMVGGRRAGRWEGLC